VREWRLRREEARAGMGVTEEGSAQERGSNASCIFHFRFSLKKSEKRKWLFSVVFEKEVSVDFIFNINRTNEKSKSTENNFLKLF
jgi:hypothetical protein